MKEASFELFRQDIAAKLQTLTALQQKRFAHRCALRALPYLFQNGDMTFWPEDKKLIFAAAIFDALDVLSLESLSNNQNFNTDLLVEAYLTANSYPMRIVAHTIYTAFNDLSTCAASSVYIAMNASTRKETEALIIDDLTAISLNQPPSTVVHCPPDVWHKFQQTLINEHCGYWAQLYERIFDNNFNVDADELKQRLNTPAEIKQHGLAATGHYMEQLTSQGATQLNETRLIILGDKGAGKTSLARRLVNPNASMASVDESTAGIDSLIWQIEKTKTKVRIWDFAGHTVTHAVHRFFLSERCLYILVYDGRMGQSDSLEYWLDHVKNYGGDSQVMIIVNEKDQHKVALPINKLKEKYAIHSVHHLSIADTQHMKVLREKIAELTSNNPAWNSQYLPRSYFKVKESLEAIFDKDEKNNDNDKFNEHISLNELYEIADFHDIKDPEQLLKDLNALGVGLWYPGLAQFDKLVLNPEWISHGIYQIINWVANRSFNHSQQSYSISLDEFTQVFASDIDKQRFGVEHHEFLYHLLIHYELVYQSQNEPNTLVFPHLLHEDQPTKDLLPYFEVGESLKIEYRASQPLPPDTISRFIARHHSQIKDNLVWREGMVLIDSQSPDTVALVREDDRVIAIAVKGSNKSAYIAELRETMNDIFVSYKSDKPELFYEVIAYGAQGELFYEVIAYGAQGELLKLNSPLMLPEQKVINHVTKEAKYFEDITGHLIDLTPTANIYNIKVKNHKT